MLSMKEKKEKYCQKCKNKDVPFIKNSVGANGNIHYLCRECNTLRAKKYRQTMQGKRAVFTAVYKSIKKHPEKQAARMKLNYHVRRGYIVKPTVCDVCNNTRSIQGHHGNYSKPLEVEWLCRECHSDTHRKKEDINQ